MCSVWRKMIGSLLLALCMPVVTVAFGNTSASVCPEVCYSRLGCFTSCPPYGFTKQRKIGRLPWAPEVIDTQFLLFSREGFDQYQAVSALNVSFITGTHFRASRKSVFIIHGFVEYGSKSWLVDMCQALLQVLDLNCFCVDWRGGSIALYTQAVNNLRVVGAEIAYFLDYLREKFGYPLSDVHLIGHSLGAHVAGEAGKRLTGLGRISGLDPASPYFDGTPPAVRIDPTDALFVDAIHTDTSSFIENLALGGFGMSETVGHIDFYPNGGEAMPGCDKMNVRPGELDDIVEDLTEAILCNHHRSYVFFTESILRPLGFMGYPAPSYSAFLEGSGFPCVSGECTTLGYFAQPKERTPGSTEEQRYYLNTGDAKQPLRWRYRVTISIIGSRMVFGSLKVSFCLLERCTQKHEVYSGVIISGKDYSAFIDAEYEVYPPEKIVFSWSKDPSDLLHSELGASQVTLEFGPNGKIFELCSESTAPEETDQTLEPC